MIQIRYILFSFLFLFSILAAAEKRIPVAVLDLETVDFDSSTKIAFSNRLRTELIEAGQFEVMERNRMENLLDEQGFQQTGACNTDECVIAAGQILGVSRMIAGSVGRVGKLFAINVRMIDVATGRILKAVSEDAPGPIENIFQNSVKKVARRLSVLAATSEEKFIGLGKLKLISKPEGATIFLDDRMLTGITPFEIDSIKAGVHVVRLQKGLQAASRAVFIAPDELTTEELVLTFSKGNLKVVTDPVGVEVFLDYDSKGLTPQLLFDLPVGSYHLKFKKNGFVDYSQIVSVMENETRVLSARMIPLVILNLSSNPPDCQVFLDDSLVGMTPMHHFQIRPGFHKLRLKKNGFINLQKDTTLVAGKEISLQYDLIPAANIAVTSEPAEARLYLNSVFRGVTPLSLMDLDSGCYHLKLVHDQFEDYFTEINLTSGMSKQLNLKLEPRKGTILVETIPAGALVELDGIKEGETPLEIRDIHFGKHLLRMIKSGFRTYEEEIEIKSSTPQLIKVNFQIAKGTLFLKLNPTDMNIFLEGRQLKEIPADGLKLPPSEYHLQAFRPGYEKFTHSILIEPNKSYNFTVTLNPKTREVATLRSIALPGWGQYYGEKKFRQYFFPILEGSALFGVITTNFIYNHRIGIYEDRQKAYLSAIDAHEIDRTEQAMRVAYQDVTSAKDWRRLFITTAIAVWGLNILDAAIFSPLRPYKLADKFDSYGFNQMQIKLSPFLENNKGGFGVTILFD
ncbi:PEGA domain-containing protein [candidate division KSB1 bacterium]|nr:PEGA domain-containing protein [candidate division KSB1 bacterium]